MSQYFPKPYESFGGDINVKVDLSNYATKADIKYDTVKTELKNKIPDTGRLVKKLDYNAEIIEIENKLISSSGLATNTALTTVNNKISRLTTVSQENRL